MAHLNKLRAEHSKSNQPIINNEIVEAFKQRFGNEYANQINKTLKVALEVS